MVSNTPLQYVLEQDDNLNSLVFQVDLFSSRGALPRDIQQVMARQKDITWASRTRYNTDVYRLLRKWKTRTYNALAKVPEECLTDEDRKRRDKLANLPEIAILHLISNRPTKASPRTMSFQRLRCRSIGGAVTLTRNDSARAANGCKYRQMAPVWWCTTCIVSVN